MKLIGGIIMGIVVGGIVALAALTIGCLDLIIGLMIGGAVGLATACLISVGNGEKDDDI